MCRALVLSVVVLLLCFSCARVEAVNHSFSLTNESPQYLIVDNFGYLSGGSIKITVDGFTYNKPKEPQDEANNYGFILYYNMPSENFLALQEGQVVPCLETQLRPGSLGRKFLLPGTSSDHSIVMEDTVAADGLYTLVYFACASAPVSFKATVVQINPGGNHLSVGMMPLPLVYWIFTGIFGIMTAYWIYRMISQRQNVFKIHVLMAALVVFKFASLLFDALRYEHIKSTGSAEGFAVPYYLFAIPKGTILFVVILLVGAGWSFLKPFLSSKDKRIFMVVLPVQVLVNVALAVVEEMVQTYANFMLWRDILRMIDFACCIAVLVPVVLTIRHLAAQAADDGRTLRNVEKLKKFRAFYLITILYLYFTRVVVVLMVSALGYQSEWMAYLFTEIAALGYYAWSGYQFRPMSDNPYLLLEEEGEVELGPVTTQMDFTDD